MDQNLQALLSEQDRNADSLEERDRPSSFKSRILKGIFLFYRWVLSPLMRAISGPGYGCRYEPSCSHYAQECFRRFSFFKALYLTLKRLLRCNPWIRADVMDPVPNSMEERECHCHQRRKVSI